jgi:hypothetical protein
MSHFGIPNKLIRLTKATMEDATYHVKIGTIMTDDFQLGNGLKQGDGLAPKLFNIALENVIRQLSIQVTSTIFYKSVQLIGYADDKHYGKNTEVHFKSMWLLEREQKKWGLTSTLKKQKQWRKAGDPEEEEKEEEEEEK